MNIESVGQLATTRETVPWAEPAALDIRSDRTRDLQDQWLRRITIEVDDHVPGARHVSRPLR